LRRIYWELENAVEMLPSQIVDLLQRAQTGKFEMHLDHRGLEPSVNRLVLGLLVSSLFLGSALMLSMQVPPLLFPSQPLAGMYRISVLGLGGFSLSVLFSLRLLRAINKSGHLDRRE
jgi:ubiquinone biosynthesis protein